MSAVATRTAGKLVCASCGNYFPASSRRIRMVLAGEASRYCGPCRSLGLTREREILPEHKEFWRAAVRTGAITRRGEVITQAWIDDIVIGIWGKT